MLVTTEPTNTTNAARKHIAHDPLGNTLGPVVLVTIETGATQVSAVVGIGGHFHIRCSVNLYVSIYW